MSAANEQVSRFPDVHWTETYPFNGTGYETLLGDFAVRVWNWPGDTDYWTGSVVLRPYDGEDATLTYLPSSSDLSLFDAQEMGLNWLRYWLHEQQCTLARRLLLQ